MKDLEKMFDEALNIVKECVGAKNVGFIYRPITINTRAKSRWGMCRRSRGHNRIEISSRILEDSVPDNATMSVLIHEILHACKDGGGHTGRWKMYANKVNEKYPQYNIERTAAAEIFGLEKRKEPEKKYEIQCQGCGYIHKSSKMSRTIQHPEEYTCTYCGGKFIRIK